MFDLRADREAAGRSARVRLIKDWARDVLQLAEDATVMVTELRCTEPGCPPLETVIAVLLGKGEQAQVKIHKPIEEVTCEDVRTVATRCALRAHAR